LNESQKPISSGSAESDPEDLLDLVVGTPKAEPKVSDIGHPPSAEKPVQNKIETTRGNLPDPIENTADLPTPVWQGSTQTAQTRGYATVKYQIVPVTASYALPRLVRRRGTALTTPRTTTLASTRPYLAAPEGTTALAPRSRGDVAERFRLSGPEIGASSPDTATTEEVPENWFKLLLKETAETVLLAVIIFLLIRVGIQNYRIEGSSMEPNFHHGEYLLVNKLAYRLGEYQRGDVIVFSYPGDPSKDYIKRIIGLPGDTVEIRDGILYVNGVAIQEPYPIRPMHAFPSGPTTVEPGHLYVLGDNRPASSDTRDWGLLDQELVIGKAWLAIFPLEQFGLVDHPQLHFTPGMAQGP
jgi:signal peptidase I